MALNYDQYNLKTMESLMIAQLKIEKWDDLISTCKKILQIDNANTKAIALLARALKENKKYKDLEIFLTKIEKKAEILEQKYNEKENTTQDEEIMLNIKKLKLKLRRKLKDIKKSKLIYHKFDLPDDVRDSHDFGGQGENNANAYKNIDIQENDNEYKKLKYSIMNANIPNAFINANDNIIQDDTDSIDDPNIYFDILKNDMLNSDAIFNLGLYFFRKKEYNLALEQLKKLTDLDYNKLTFVYMKIGDIYYNYFKDINLALENYLKSIVKNKTDICFIKIGRCYALLNDEEKEIEYYSKALDYNNEQEWANFFMGCALEKKKKTEESLVYLKKAYELDKSNVAFIIKYCEELSKLNHKRDIDVALEILKNGIITYPGKTDIHVCLSDIYLKMQDFTKAIEILEEANRNAEFYSNAEKLFKLGVVYEKINDFSKAISVFKTVLNLKKDHTPSLCHIGFILASTKEYKRSLKYFKYAIKVNPELGYAYYGIGKIFQQIENYDDALEYYAISLEKNPNNYK